MLVLTARTRFKFGLHVPRRFPRCFIVVAFSTFIVVILRQSPAVCPTESLESILSSLVIHVF